MAKSEEPTRDKHKLLDDSDSDSDDGGAAIESAGFKVNEEYARRFEYNKKREEKERLEEKLKKTNGEDDDDDSSSTDETEDEDGFLATEDLDAQISATLNAIRNKDPRVYDKNVTFYNAEDGTDQSTKAKKEKPVFLRDYQREKILRGDVGASDDEEEAPRTYAQEQDALKDSLLAEIHAAKDSNDSDEDEDEDDDGFMKRKEPAKTAVSGVHPARAQALKVAELDVENADKDPETFLSNFMAARAWVADEGSKWKAFESDDGEDDDDNRAEEFEQAYNMRFEDPEKSNEVLRSYARDLAASKSVRREEKTGRKRQRELEREKKEAEKQQRRDDKARLRKLKLEEAEEKLQKIKHAAGASGKELGVEDWMKFLDDAWEDDKWEDEMKKRFGDEYYALNEGDGSDDDLEEKGGDEKKKKKLKKPKWDDDINIKDIIPDFEDEETRPAVELTDDEAAQGNGEEVDDDDDDEDLPPSKKRKASDHKRSRIESQKKSRQERAQLEALVDAKLQLTDHDVLQGSSSKAGGGGGGGAGFRYRETSPQAFGMTARDILLAPSDKVLNEYAGLKKLATFRDAEKKRRDKKRLGKKARLRQWRRDVFGTEFERSGPTYGFEDVKLDDDDEDDRGVRKDERPRQSKDKSKGKGKKEEAGDSSNIIGEVDGVRKKRKRSKGKKSEKAAA